MVVDTLAEVEALRSSLKALIWPSGGYPSSRAIDELESYSHAYWGAQANFSALQNFSGTLRTHVDQYLGVNVRPIHFVPSVRRNRGLIFAIGHDSGPWYPMPRNVLYRFLVQGFDVVTVAMPLLFMEDRPAITGLDGPAHDYMGDFQTASFHPLAWFLEPSIAAINYLDGLGCSDISMTGYSGGGWCTTMMAALDTRIAHSYPVAGGFPLDVRVGNEFGDWEQYQADVWEAPTSLDYRDLHAMAADRAGRTQIEITNQYDPIFPDDGRAAVYGPDIAAAATALGGEWSIYVDANVTEHVITDRALNLMMADLGVTGEDLW